MRFTVIDGLHNGWRSGVKPGRSRGAKGPLRERPLPYRISPSETRGRFRGITSLPPDKRKKTARQGLNDKPVQDLDKADIITGSDLYIFIDIVYYDSCFNRLFCLQLILETVFVGNVQTTDFGDCLLVGIVQTMDFGDHLFIGAV